MFPAPSTRGQADEAMECPRERGLVSKAALVGDVGERGVLRREQFLGALDAVLCQPAVARNAEARLEGAREVADRQTACAGEVRQPKLTREVRVQELLARRCCQPASPPLEAARLCFVAP